MNPAVAVIDLGSNSIKLLVATSSSTGEIQSRFTRALEVRISAGISQAAPRLSEEAMVRGLGAIRMLLADAAPFAPTRIVLVATSAVRDASNGLEFRDRVRAVTGHAIRILTGDEEADLIGRGLTCDPALGAVQDFYVFDLGGGSLECLAFRGRKVAQTASLQLGCVRLAEKFVPEPDAPFAPTLAPQIAAECNASFDRAGFVFNLPDRAIVVGTGGSLTTARAILAAHDGCTLEVSPPDITVDALRRLLLEIGSLPLTARQQVPALPPARADVFPTALATLIAVAERGQFPAFRHSLFNLRFGLAREALGI